MRRRVRCSRCGRTLLVPLHSVAHFHHCRPLAPISRARLLLGGDLIDWPTPEEARRAIWADFEGGPPDDEDDEDEWVAI